MNAISTEKSELRREIRARLQAVSAGERANGSLKLREVLLGAPIWADASRVLCFASLEDEPDIQWALDQGWDANKAMFLPRFDSQTGTYGAARVRSRGEIVRGRFGVAEPGAECPAVPLNQLDLALVPGVAFDLTGRRLGRGRGFYDRLLAEVRGHKCGVCFDLQIVDRVPEEPHDVRLNSILTPTRWHEVSRAA